MALVDIIALNTMTIRDDNGDSISVPLLLDRPCLRPALLTCLFLVDAVSLQHKLNTNCRVVTGTYDDDVEG